VTIRSSTRHNRARTSIRKRLDRRLSRSYAALRLRLSAQPRTAAAIASRRRTTQEKVQRVRDAVSQLRRRSRPVTFPAVARTAGVSRTFLYQNADA
jgi:hypothetical protein